MKNSLLALCTCIVILAAHLLHAQDGMRYREFQLGSDVASVGNLTRLDNLAQTASAEAVRLDVKEAPQREIARQKNESDEALGVLKKAKTENQAVFRP